MLFVESKTLAHSLNGSERIQLLDDLQQRDLIPLIRSARLNCFENALSDHEYVSEMETEIARGSEQETREPYIIGDLFCLNDHAFFLVCDDHDDSAPILKAGIIYETRTAEPFRKLDAFCSDVRDLIITARKSQQIGQDVVDLPHWEQGKSSMPLGFKRFVSKQDSDSLFTRSRKETMSDRVRAASILEDTSARVFLRRAKEAHAEGYAAKLLSGDTLSSYESSIERLTDAGLVEREVQVSCRKTGHALFRLPSANALAVVTVSDATCSECGSPVADEKVEEVIAPTRLAASLLEDGSWLISRLHQVLREIGIPESEIAVGTSEGDGYGQMMVNICGESFLVVARDGDLTPSFARWAIDLEMETDASHLVVVATGRLHNHAGMLLDNHSRRRTRAGQDFEMILADDATTAGEELRRGFERVSQRVLTEHLCPLDSSLGLSMSRVMATKFKMQRAKENSWQSGASMEVAENLTPFRPPLTLAANASGGSHSIVSEEVRYTDIDVSNAAEDQGDETVSGSLDSATQGYQE